MTKKGKLFLAERTISKDTPDKKYNIFLSANTPKIEDKARMRVDLYGATKITDIDELKEYNVRYYTSGHNEVAKINNEYVPCRVRYIQIYAK